MTHTVKYPRFERSPIARFVRSAALVFICMPTLAASFDCTKARSATERMICADQNLSSLDEDLAKHYARALEHIADKGELKKGQRNWLATKRRECRDTACLVTAYQSRIAELGSLVSEVDVFAPIATTPLTAAEVNACRAVVDASNHGKLAELEEKSAWTKLDEASFEDIFGPDWPMEPGGEYLSVDLDDDGTPDHFAMSTAWPSLTNFSLGRLSRPGSETVVLNDPKNENQRLLTIEKRRYILTENLVRGHEPGNRRLSMLGSTLQVACARKVGKAL